MKFPNEITVIVANSGKGSAEFLDIANDESSIYQTQRAARYRIVSEGVIQVERRFTSKKKGEVSVSRLSRR